MQLANITSFILLSFIAAGLAQFIQMCMGKGMIFHKYKAWLTYWFKFKPRKKYYIDRSLYVNHHARKSNWGYSYVSTPEQWYAWFFKPLGGCIYCFSVWLTTIAYIVVVALLGVPKWMALLCWPYFIGSMYVFLELIENKIK